MGVPRAIDSEAVSAITFRRAIGHGTHNNTAVHPTRTARVGLGRGSAAGDHSGAFTTPHSVRI